MNCVTATFTGPGSIYIESILHDIAHKITSTFHDVRGTGVHEDPRKKVKYTFISLNNESDLNDVVRAIANELKKNEYIINNQIDVIEDHRTPLIHGSGVVVVSLVKSIERKE